MEPDAFTVRRARFPFMEWFDGHVISGIEDVAKPDPRIFEILLRRYGLEPRATVFVDDTSDNVRAARVPARGGESPDSPPGRSSRGGGGRLRSRPDARLSSFR
jgi:2-haloacid dehalogenase